MIGKDHNRASSPAARAAAWIWLALGVLGYAAFQLVVEDDLARWWVFQSAFLGISGVFLVRHIQVRGGDLFHPLVPVITLLYLYCTSSALNVREEGSTYHGVPVTSGVLAEFYLCSIVGLVGLVLGAWFAQRLPGRNHPGGRADPGWLVPDRLCRKKLLLYGIVLAIPFWPMVIARFNPYEALGYSEIAAESRIVWAENPDQVALGVLAGIPVQYLLGAAILIMLKQRHLLIKAVAATLVSMYTLVPLRNGFRGEVVGIAMIILAVYHYRIRRLGLASIVLVFVLGHLFVTGMCIARQSSDPKEMVQLLAAEVAEGNASAFGVRNSGELWTAQNLMAQIRFLQDGQTSFMYGRSVWTELLEFVPRVFWPDRPLSLAQQFTEILSPGDTARGKGYGFFILQEGYWNWGTLGVFVSMFCVGWLLEGVYGWFMERMQCDLAALGYGAVLFVSATAVRSGIILLVKYGLILAVPFILLGYLPYGRNSRAELRAASCLGSVCPPKAR